MAAETIDLKAEVLKSDVEVDTATAQQLQAKAKQAVATVLSSHQVTLRNFQLHFRLMVMGAPLDVDSSGMPHLHHLSLDIRQAIEDVLSQEPLTQGFTVGSLEFTPVS